MAFFIRSSLCSYALCRYLKPKTCSSCVEQNITKLNCNLSDYLEFSREQELNAVLAFYSSNSKWSAACLTYKDSGSSSNTFIHGVLFSHSALQLVPLCEDGLILSVLSLSMSAYLCFSEQSGNFHACLKGSIIFV